MRRVDRKYRHTGGMKEIYKNVVRFRSRKSS